MPKGNNKIYVGNCTFKDIVSKAIETYKKSNVESPLKTGIPAANYAIKKIPLAKNYNTGFNVGKAGFVVKQTFDETCKRKK